MNSTVSENGGCDAILGSECSQNIRNALQQSHGAINGTACGVTVNFLSNSSILWIYTESDPSINGDYDELMK